MSRSDDFDEYDSSREFDMDSQQYEPEYAHTGLGYTAPMHTGPMHSERHPRSIMDFVRYSQRSQHTQQSQYRQHSQQGRQGQQARAIRLDEYPFEREDEVVDPNALSDEELTAAIAAGLFGTFDTGTGTGTGTSTTVGASASTSVKSASASASTSLSSVGPSISSVGPSWISPVPSIDRSKSSISFDVGSSGSSGSYSSDSSDYSSPRVSKPAVVVEDSATALARMQEEMKKEAGARKGVIMSRAPKFEEKLMSAFGAKGSASYSSSNSTDKSTSTTEVKDTVGSSTTDWYRSSKFTSADEFLKLLSEANMSGVESALVEAKKTDTLGNLIDARGVDGESPLMILAGCPHSKDTTCRIARLLLSYGADPRANDYGGRAAKEYAYSAGNTSLYAILSSAESIGRVKVAA
jgi:hypothetical protein